MANNSYMTHRAMPPGLIGAGVAHYGGSKLYPHLKPLMIGLITGDMVGSLLPMLRRTTLHMITGATLPLFRLLLI